MKVKIEFNELERICKDSVVVNKLDNGENVITLKIPTSLEVEATPVEVEEDWPKEGDLYHYPNIYHLGLETNFVICHDHFRNNDEVSKNMKILGLIFKTKEEAIAKAKEIEAWLLENKK